MPISIEASMRFVLTVSSALLTLPLLGGGADWFPRSEGQAPFDAQLFMGRASPRFIEVLPPTGWLKVEAPSQNLWGARLGLDLLRWGPGLIQASAGHSRGSRSPLRYHNSVGASGEVGADLHMQSQWMAGLAYFHGRGRFKSGFGLDFRREELIVEAPPHLQSSGQLNRVWWRAVAQYHFEPIGTLRPYLALEVAAPFTSHTPQGVAYINDLDDLGMPNNTSRGEAAKTHAPRFLICAAFGVRFGATRSKPAAIATMAMPIEPIQALETTSAPSPSIPEPAPLPTVVPRATQPMALPKVIVLDEAALHFAFNRAEIPEEGQRVLAQWADRIANVSPPPRLQVTGHADGRGTREYNRALSLRRAEAVAEVLRSRGLSIAGSDVVGMGSDQPVESNAEESGRARNRRVEIHLEAPEGASVKGRVESALQIQTRSQARTTRTPSRKGGK